MERFHRMDVFDISLPFFYYLICFIIITSIFYASNKFHKTKFDSFSNMNVSEKEALKRSVSQLENDVNELTVERNSYKKSLVEYEVARFVDPITGIPNNLLWEHHLLELTELIDEKSKFQAMLIDLVDFGDVNERYRMHTTNLVLGYLARSVRDNMRRNEHMYKRRRPELAPVEARVRSSDIDMFRKYPGGDEFYMYLRGSERDAIGHLTRIHRNVRSGISDEIGRNILKESITIRFYAACCPIFKEDRVKDIESRLEDLLFKAKNDPITRIQWLSMRENYDPKDENEKIFRDAIQEFRI